ncbi:hypothetical protein KHA80_19205 [Anaerobacillus sp. HL2]|nr:hypothetical protein KHA80_19205 [Anaerobacillus sp. HL2]
MIKNTEPEIVGEPIIKSNHQKSTSNGNGCYITSRYRKPYFIEGFEIAGKTGTAEISNTEGPGYPSGLGQYIYSFVGVAPKSDPKLVVYVAVDRPKLEHMSLDQLQYQNIYNNYEHSLQYLEISPNSVSTESRFVDEGTRLENNFVGKNVEQMKSALDAVGLETVVLGSGNKVESHPPIGGTMLTFLVKK